MRQTFNRRVLEPHLNDAKEPLSLLFAIPDHPWVPTIIRHVDARDPSSGTAAEGFGRVCDENDIEHRQTNPCQPWVNGPVDRMNRAIKEAAVKRYHYGSHEQLRFQCD